MKLAVTLVGGLIFAAGALFAGWVATTGAVARMQCVSGCDAIGQGAAQAGFAALVMAAMAATALRRVKGLRT